MKKKRNKETQIKTMMYKVKKIRGGGRNYKEGGGRGKEV